MPFKFLIILSVIIALGYADSKAQVISNQGTEFWAVFPTHVPDMGDNGLLLANMSVFITSPQASSGKVSVGAFTTSFTVAANTVTEVKIPRSSAYIDEAESGKVLSDRAIRILVDDGKPKVVVYAHIFAGRRSAAAIILPRDALGKEYYSMNYNNDDTNDGKNFIIVIASQDNTSVQIKKGNTDLVPGGVMLSKAGDVYEYLSKEDLTGVSVKSSTSGCNSFAVFTGSSGTHIVPPICTFALSLDPLYQQAYPVQSWGLNYGFVPFSMKSPTVAEPVRTRGQFVRILAKDNATTVRIDGVVVATLNAGQYYTTPVPLTKPAFITANKPVCVAQYALSEACSGNPDSLGDPEMVILNPIEYSISDITVYSSSFENIKEQYINILIKDAGITSFKINGTAPPSPFIPMPTLPGYSYLQLNLNGYNTNNFHIVSKEGFNAIAYGFGMVESYAYSAGTNLFANYSINAIKHSTNQIIESACVSDDYFFRLTLPFNSTKITWQLDATETPVLQKNPAANTVSINGVMFYEYTFPKTPAYSNEGVHAIKIYADYPASECSTAGQLEINNEFTVTSPPKTNFTFTSTGCNNTFKFEPAILSGETDGLSWTWDFGDGTVTSGTGPFFAATHTYSTVAGYVVKLITSNGSGCSSSIQKTVQVTKSEQPDFEISGLNCVEKPVTFKDKSIFTDFIPATWEWQFGDGQSMPAGSNAQVIHNYAIAGEYTVKLIIKNANGCVQEVTKVVKINATPAPDFLFSQTCTGATTTFTNLTTDAPQIQYLWNFGDSNSTGNNPNTSALKHPVHIYNVPGTYIVTLTASLPNGCEHTLLKTIEMTSINITPQFDIQSPTCSGDVIKFKNTSVTNGQTIKTIEWYFDTDNEPNKKEVYSNPANNSEYPHTYPVLPPGVVQYTYHVKLRLYAEGGCFSEIFKEVQITANPKITFNALENVCTSANAFQLTQAQETSGLSGTGNYWGNGVSANGFFDPAIAGEGTHTIEYRFNSAGGCLEIGTQNITVVKAPKVTLPAVVDLVKNESLLLQPLVEGSNLSYQWSPAVGLNSSTIPNPIVAPSENVTYTLTVSNGLCSASASVLVNIIKPIKTYNTFTPNGDGINDIWIIQNIEEYPEATIDIFNRYGITIFHSTGYAIPWDGKHNNANVPGGTYYYIISPGYKLKKLSGSITVIR